MENATGGVQSVARIFKLIEVPDAQPVPLKAQDIPLDDYNREKWPAKAGVSIDFHADADV